MTRAMLAVLVVSLSILALPLPGLVHAEWRTVPTTRLLPGDPTLTLTASSDAPPVLTVQSQTPGDLKWVVGSLPVTPGEAIDAVEICYQAPDEGTFIRQVRLVEARAAQALVTHDEAIALRSPTGECHRSAVLNYAPVGAVSLWIRLEFAEAADAILIEKVSVQVP